MKKIDLIVYFDGDVKPCPNDLIFQVAQFPSQMQQGVKIYKCPAGTKSKTLYINIFPV